GLQNLIGRHDDTAIGLHADLQLVLVVGAKPARAGTIQYSQGNHPESSEPRRRTHERSSRKAGFRRACNTDSTRTPGPTRWHGMSQPLLEVTDLHKRYGDTVALDHVSVAVAEGELFGLLGPNGAGKTTLLSIVSCLLGATSGEVRLA